jgi:uncharacterized protein YfaQ (DUF2300 family)
MGWRQIGTVALLVTAASAQAAQKGAAAQRAGEPLRFETLKDAHDRQRAEDHRQRTGSRSLLQNERQTPLGDSRVHAMPPPTGYTTQPRPQVPLGR